MTAARRAACIVIGGGKKQSRFPPWSCTVSPTAAPLLCPAVWNVHEHNGLPLLVGAVHDVVPLALQLQDTMYKHTRRTRKALSSVNETPGLASAGPGAVWKWHFRDVGGISGLWRACRMSPFCTVRRFPHPTAADTLLLSLFTKSSSLQQRAVKIPREKDMRGSARAGRAPACRLGWRTREDGRGWRLLCPRLHTCRPPPSCAS